MIDVFADFALIHLPFPSLLNLFLLDMLLYFNLFRFLSGVTVRRRFISSGDR